MNILCINHYAGSFHHGMEYRPYYLAREWIKLGHSVTIVAASFSHLRKHNIIIDQDQHYLHENIDGIHYIWCKTPRYNGNGIRRLINILVFLWRLKRLMPWLNKHFVPQVVIASSTYPFDVKIAKNIARKSYARLVYEVHDLWPLTLIELNGFSKYHPLILAMQKAENYAYKHVDKVISLLPKAEAYMQEHGLCANKFVYIPNGICVTDNYQQQETLPDLHAHVLKNLKTQYQFVLGYTGSIGIANALDDLLMASVDIQRVAVVLVGDGILKEQLIRQNTSRRNVVFLPPVAKSQIPSLLALMDGLYLGWHNLAIYRFGISPNKLFDYMLAAKPIIHATSASNDLVSIARCGISVIANDISAIKNAILDLMNMSGVVRAQLGQNGKDYVSSYHDYAVLAKKFLLLLQPMQR